MSIDINAISDELITSEQLRVEQIPDFYYDGIVKVHSTWRDQVAAWEVIAAHKASLCKNRDSERIQFENSKDVCSNIKIGMGIESRLKYHACIDKNGHIQGMMSTLIMVDRVVVKYLVTNPNNIRSNLNEMESIRAKGAGTALLQHAEGLAVREKKGSVCLCGLESAIPFYKKNGYQELEYENEFLSPPTIDGQTEMIKTIQTATSKTN